VSTRIGDWLEADGPTPGYESELALFGRFVGSWAMNGWMADGARRRTTFEGEWHFGWVLGGLGVQDVLTWRPAGSDRPVGAGTSVRIFVPATRTWWVTWQAPTTGEVSALHARAKGRDVVIDGHWTAGEQWRARGPQSRFEWRFTEIEAEAFTWQGRRSEDGGASWRLVEEMKLSRISENADGAHSSR
jgi:hypothetical protein